MTSEHPPKTYIETPEVPPLDEATKEKLSSDYGRLYGGEPIPVPAPATDEIVDSRERLVEKTRNVGRESGEFPTIPAANTPAAETHKKLSPEEEWDKKLEGFVKDFDGGQEEAFNNPGRLLKMMTRGRELTRDEEREELNRIKGKRDSILKKLGVTPKN